MANTPIRHALAAAAILLPLGAAPVLAAPRGPALHTAGAELVQYRGDDRYGRDDRSRDDRGRDDRYGRDDRGGGAPGGSYLRSCNEARMEGSALVAVCQGGRGRRFETSIDVRGCGRSDIGNDNGTLQCAGARGRSRRID